MNVKQLHEDLVQLLDHDEPPGMLANRLANALIKKLDGICNDNKAEAIGLIVYLREMKDADE